MSNSSKKGGGVGREWRDPSNFRILVCDDRKKSTIAIRGKKGMGSHKKKKTATLGESPSTRAYAIPNARGEYFSRKEKGQKKKVMQNPKTKLLISIVWPLGIKIRTVQG